MPAGNGRSITNGDLIKTAERRAFVLGLRRAGLTYAQIATQTEERFGVENLPNGWDCRYAYKDVMRELVKLREDMAEDAENIRRLELERLDSMLRSVWPLAVPPKESPVDSETRFKAIDRVLKIADRRLRLVPELAVATEYDLKGGGPPLLISERVYNLTRETDDGTDDSADATRAATEHLES